MRAAVIGASNSLVEGGVVQGLMDGGLDVIANGSLEQSQAVILPFRLDPSQLGCTDFEHLIVEIATTEQTALRCSLADFETIQAVLDWTVQWCLRRGVGITLVTMPELSSYTQNGDLRAFEVGRFLAAYAQERQIQNFDGYAWLDAWAADHGTTPADCFDAPAHMRVEIAHAFGERIADSIETAAPQLRRRHRTPREFEYVSFATTSGWEEADRIARSSPRESTELLRLQPGTGFDVGLPPGSIVGTVHNSAGTNAVLGVDGLQSRAKRLDAALSSELALTAWGLRTPVPVDGRTVLTAVDVTYLPDLEHNHASVWRRPTEKARRRPTTVEIAGLIVAV